MNESESVFVVSSMTAHEGGAVVAVRRTLEAAKLAAEADGVDDEDRPRGGWYQVVDNTWRAETAFSSYYYEIERFDLP